MNAVSSFDTGCRLVTSEPETTIGPMTLADAICLAVERRPDAKIVRLEMLSEERVITEHEIRRLYDAAKKHCRELDRQSDFQIYADAR